MATLLGIIGHSGRMGRELIDHVRALDDIEVGPLFSSAGNLTEFIDARRDVVVDLSTGSAVDHNALAIVNAGIPYIVGATGYSPETLARLTAAAVEKSSSVLVVPNFSLGANLMLRFATLAAAVMEYPAVTERHHAGKADAPSGTALHTARRIAEARAASTERRLNSTAASFGESLPSVLGGAEHDVALHSLRGHGYLAEQEVRFTLPGESLIIEHRSIDRRCFMPGIVYAVRNINRVRGLQIGLDTIMDF